MKKHFSKLFNAKSSIASALGLPFWAGTFVLTILLSNGACKSKNNNNADKALARVGDITLYQSDLEGVLPANISAADSAQLISRYIDRWVQKQLLMAEAKTQVQIDQKTLERKVQEYRYDLMAYELTRSYIDQRLDTAITEAEIKQYYEENIDNFQLKNNIVKALFLVVPTGAPDRDELPGWLQAYNEDNAAKILTFAQNYASFQHLNDTVWIDFEALVRGTPLAEVPNKIDFLKLNRYYAKVDGTSSYYLRVLEFKISDDTSPLPFVRDRVREMILNQRKVLLAKQLEQEIYEKAKKKNAFEIFNKP
ncbi:hypothetical protein [Eisenibacter elegans]|jgi:hypothetical protein|uniref:hypothetical protein n=1 Tax=Eisenibacter elegans TaxID=997 RepID=UPI0004248C45|nr:hypothetical protein [Eisenibacter elegans]